MGGSTPLRPLGNDRWRATFPVSELGRYQFSIRAMVDDFATWRRAFVLRASTGCALALDLAASAARLVRCGAQPGPTGVDRRQLAEFAGALEEAARRAERAEAGAAVETSDTRLADPELEPS